MSREEASATGYQADRQVKEVGAGAGVVAVARKNEGRVVGGGVGA
jgi:hypothetical protein